MILFFYSNFLAAILIMANFTVIGLYFILETVIFAFYGKFPIRMRMSPYSGCLHILLMMSARTFF